MALKNRPDLVADLVDSFDLAITEQCHEYDECEGYLPFVEQGKPILDAEYASKWVDEEARIRDCVGTRRCARACGGIGGAVGLVVGVQAMRVS